MKNAVRIICIRIASAVLLAVFFAEFAPIVSASGMQGMLPSYIYRARMVDEVKNLMALDIFIIGTDKNLAGGYFSLRYDGELFELCDNNGNPITAKSPVEFAKNNSIQPKKGVGGVVTDSPNPAGNLGVDWAVGKSVAIKEETLLATCYLKIKGIPGDVNAERLSVSRSEDFTAYFNGGMTCDYGAWFKRRDKTMLKVSTGEARAILDYSALSGGVAVVLTPWAEGVDLDDYIPPGYSVVVSSSATSGSDAASQAPADQGAAGDQLASESDMVVSNDDVMAADGTASGGNLMLHLAAGAVMFGVAAYAFIFVLRIRQKNRIHSENLMPANKKRSVPLLLASLFDKVSGGALPNRYSPEYAPKKNWVLGMRMFQTVPKEDDDLWQKRINQ